MRIIAKELSMLQKGDNTTVHLGYFEQLFKTQHHNCISF